MIRGKRKYIIYSVILLLVLGLSVGFSAFQKQLLIDDSIFNVRLQVDTRVSGNSIQKVSGNAVSNSEDYNVKKIYGNVTFPTTSSYVLYKVDLTNYGNVKTGLLNITSNSSGINYQICDSNGNNCTSDPKTSVCNGNSCTLGSTKTIYVKVTSTSTGTKNVDLDLEFAPIHTVTYENFRESTISFKTDIMEGETYEVTLSSSPEEVSGTNATVNYNSSNNKLTITGVTNDSDVTAKYLATNIADTSYTGSDPDNYVRYNDTLFRIITKETVDDGYDNSELRAKITKDESIGQYDWGELDYYDNLSNEAKEQVDTTLWYDEDEPKVIDYFNYISKTDFNNNSSWLNKDQFTINSVKQEGTGINNNKIQKYIKISPKTNNNYSVSKILTHSSVYAIQNKTIVQASPDALMDTYPTLYLHKDVLIMGGLGTRTNPYLLSMKNDSLQPNPTVIEGKDLTVTGSSQQLVTVTNQIGTPRYSLTTPLNSSNYTSGSTTIPSANATGYYTIYYYIPAMDGFKAKQGSVTTTISGIKYTINYQKGSNVSAIGKTSDTCTTSGTSLTCNVTLPSITPSSGWENGKWNYNSNQYNPGASFTLNSSNTGLTMSSSVTGKTYTATIIYYNGSSVTSTTRTCTVSTGNSCAFTLTTAVTGSKGVYNSAYKGIASVKNSMTSAALSMTQDTTFYAIYSESVSNRYWNTSSYTTRTLYRNEFFINDANIGVRLATTNNSTTNYTPENGPGGSTWVGLSTANDTTAEYNSVESAAASTSTSLYTIYQFSIKYEKGANVSSIGAPGGTCKVTSATSCNVTLPSITPNTGYTSVGWSATNGSSTGVTGTYTLSTSGQTLYANATGSIYTATFYYYDGTQINTTTSNCTVSNVEGNCTVSVPVAVQSSTGPYGSPYKGVSDTASTMEAGSLTISTNGTKFYANYSSGDATNTKVTRYYYSSGYKSNTIYRNEYFISDNAISTVLSTADNGTTNYTSSKGPGSSNWLGLSTAKDTTPEYSTVQAAANSTNRTFYTVYQFVINYQKGSNVSAIGSDSATCNVTTSDTSCSVILPTITPNTNYTSVGWSDTNGATTGQAALTTYTLTANNRVLYANAIAANYLNTSTNEAYTTLKEAFSAVESNQTIKVLQDTTETTTAELAYGKTGIKLDLNGKTITSSASNYAITNYGTLDIYNTSSTTGTITGSSSAIIGNMKTLTLNGTSSTNQIVINKSDSGYCIFNNSSSSLTINDNVSLTGYRGIWNHGNTVFTGGSITTTNGGIDNYNTASLNISGNTQIQSNEGISNSATLVISGGTITGTSSYGIENTSTTSNEIEYNGNTTINGGKITGYLAGIYNDSSREINISGTTTQILTSSNDTGSGITSSNGVLRIANGTITGGERGIGNQGSSQLFISGGTITGLTEYGVHNSNEATITGGTVTGAQHGIHLSGLLNLGTKDSNVSTSNPLIQTIATSDYYGIYIRSGGSVNFYDGIIKSSSGTGYAISGTIADTPTGYSVYKETTNGVESAYLMGSFLNTSTNVSYTTLNEAFSAVASNQTIKVLRDTTETSTATLDSNKTLIKLDLNGKTVTMSNTYIKNNGILDIYNSSSTNGTVTGGSDQVIYNNGTLTLNGTSSTNKIVIDKTSDGEGYGAIYNLSSKSLTVNSNVEVKVSEGTSSGIYNKGITTITGGTIESSGGNGIYIDSGTVTLGIKDSSVSTSSPLVQTTSSSDNYGVYHYSGTFNFYDGIIKSFSGMGYSIYGTVSNTPDDYVVRKSATYELYEIESATLGELVRNYQNTSTNKYYETLSSAFSAVAKNQTIKVLNDVNETSTTLASSKTGIKLDLNGKKIYIGQLINNGTLDIYNSSSTDATMEGGGQSLLYNDGTLTLNGTSSTNRIIINKTTNNNFNGAITNNRNKSLTIYDNVEIKVSAGRSSGIYNPGNLTINGGSITGTDMSAISNSGTLTMNSGIVTYSAGPAINNNGTATITGGSITGNTGISNSRGKTLNVSGSSTQITGTTSDGIYNRGTATINGGIISGADMGISNAKESVSGTVYYGTLTVTSGTISGETKGINSTGVLTLGTKDSNVSTSIPLIQTTGTSGNYGIYIESTGSFNFYDGIVKSSSGTGYAINGTVSDTPTDYYVYKETTSGVESAYLKNTYTVSFNANGGSGGQSANVTATYGNSMPTISSTAPTKAGYTFMGWYDNQNYTSGTQYYTAAGVSSHTWNKTENTTLYAGWQAIPIAFSCGTKTKTFSTSSQTANVTSATGGSGTFTYSKVSGESDITLSSAGVITIPANKSSGSYTIVAKATDSNNSLTSESTCTINIGCVGVTNQTYTVGNNLTYAGNTYTIVSNSSTSVGLALNTTSGTGTYNNASTYLNTNFIGNNNILKDARDNGCLVDQGSGVYISSNSGSTTHAPSSEYWVSSGKVYVPSTVTKYTLSSTRYSVGYLEKQTSKAVPGSIYLNTGKTESTLYSAGSQATVSNTSSSITYSSSKLSSTKSTTPYAKSWVSFMPSKSCGSASTATLPMNRDQDGALDNEAGCLTTTKTFKILVCGGTSHGKTYQLTTSSTTKYSITPITGTASTQNYSSNYRYNFAGANTSTTTGSSPSYVRTYPLNVIGGESHCDYRTTYTVSNVTKNIYYRPYIIVKKK